MPHKNPEYIKAYKRKHYLENKEKYLKSQAKSKRKNRPKKREFVKRYKKFCGCQRCGYDESVNALEFHHIDPSIKDSTVSRLIAGNWSLKKIKAEIRKCVVLCANCHRLIHEQYDKGIKNKWFIYSEDKD